MSAPTKSFIIYAHEDQAIIHSLINQLAPLKKSGKLTIWHDERILPGVAWDAEIRKNLKEADIIILIVSSDFLASDYIDQVEFKLALERHRQGKAIMVPVIARPCLWEEDATLVSLQALPRHGQAISTWINRDEAFLDTAKGVTKLLSDIHIKAAERRQSIEAVENAIKLYDEGQQLEAYNLLIKHAKEEHGVNPRGFHILGRIYSLGEANIVINQKEAVKLYKIAGGLGYKYSYNNIGTIYFNEGNYTEAYTWYSKGVEIKDPYSMNALGEMFLNGTGVEVDEERAATLFLVSAQHDNSMAMRNLGRLHERQKNYSEALIWYGKAAIHGNHFAQYELGLLYEAGKFQDKNVSDAMQLYRAASKLGNNDASFQLGMIYFKGRDKIDVDFLEAKICFGIAAGRGHSNSQVMLGYMFEHGYGAKQPDYENAIKWYYAAAQQAHPVGEYNMGTIFEGGKYVDKNINLAKEWYKASAAHGYELAIKRLKELDIA